MNRILLTLKRPFIWLYRFRHRCGYGVHSPFAFNLITHVIYESTAYYKYEELAKAQKQLELEKDKRWKYESKKVKRLLFRLVNYTQPETIVDAGTLAASALYLKAGKEGADYTSASDLSELFLESGVPVDFLYLHDYRHPTLFCPRRRSFLPAVFVPVGPPGFPENGCLFCRKVVLCPEKKH